MTSDARRRPPGSPEQLEFNWKASSNTNEPTDQVEDPAIPPTPATSLSTLKSDAAASAATTTDGYAPSHPWHYLPEGDNAPPIPFDAIPLSEEAGKALERDLPRSAAKRIIKIRELFDAERKGLEEARARYEDVIARGAEALSRYDREIAYGGNDKMARAGTLALLYNQISWWRGRITFLEREQSRQGARSR